MAIVTVRYGEMRQIGQVKTSLEGLKVGERCVIKTDRGTEIATVVYSTQRKEIKPGDKTEGRQVKEQVKGEILRQITPEDMEKLGKIYSQKVPQEFELCQQKIKKLNLQMKLAFVEHLLGGEKVIFYYLAEGRVDFRELVRELAKEYKTRIEMKQIGVRDEARLIGDFEHCGQELCCRTFLKELEPVTMRMAKNQKTTMDPSKISGRCGRLMCCLKYEDEGYLKLKSKLPKKGARVQIAKGEGEVIDIDVLAQEAVVELAAKDKVRVKAEEIIKIIRESTLKVEDND